MSTICARTEVVTSASRSGGCTSQLHWDSCIPSACPTRYVALRAATVARFGGWSVEASRKDVQFM